MILVMLNIGFNILKGNIDFGTSIIFLWDSDKLTGKTVKATMCLFLRTPVYLSPLSHNCEILET